MNWNILVISGKNTNKYFVCTGEGMRKKNLYNLTYNLIYFYKKNIKNISKKGNSPVLY